MEYEFNVKNTWDFWIKTVAPQLPTGNEREVDEVQLARLLTSFTEKFEDNKVSYFYLLIWEVILFLAPPSHPLPHTSCITICHYCPSLSGNR